MTDYSESGKAHLLLIGSGLAEKDNQETGNGAGF
jgi:hypothetical protein